MQIDFASQTIRLLERGEVQEAGGEILPLKTRNDVPCARVSVNGNAPNRPRLDTECNTARMGRDERQGEGARPHHDRAQPWLAARLLHRLVQLGEQSASPLRSRIHAEQMFAGEAGLIGNGLLSRFTVTIDSAKRRRLLASR